LKKIILIIVSLCVVLYADTELAEPKPSFDNPRKIIFTITEDSEYALSHILSTANNVLKVYGPENVDMKIVAYSKGIKLLLKENISRVKRVETLMQYDVMFIACKNTMRTKNIDENDLIDGTEVVTAGVVELIERIKLGWVYIKP